MGRLVALLVSLFLAFVVVAIEVWWLGKSVMAVIVLVLNTTLALLIGYVIIREGVVKINRLRVFTVVICTVFIIGGAKYLSPSLTSGEVRALLRYSEGNYVEYSVIRYRLNGLWEISYPMVSGLYQKDTFDEKSRKIIATEYIGTYIEPHQAVTPAPETSNISAEDYFRMRQALKK